MKSPVVKDAVETTASLARAGVQAAGRAAKMAIIKQKFQSHLKILGKNFYRLTINGENPAGNSRINAIISTLKEIETEIEAIERESNGGEK